MLWLAADLPDAPVRLAPMLERVLYLMARHGPYALVEPVPGLRVQVEGVEYHAPHVVLLLFVGGVADADRPRALIAVQMLQDVLVEVAPAVDAVDDLQVAAVTLDQVGNEREIVVRLPLESQGEQAPERERRVPDPAVAVVPVPLAARRLRQRGGRGGGDRPGRREREALERQGAAGEVGPPAVVGEAAPGQPVLPVVSGPGQPPVGLLVVLGWRSAAPRQGAEAGVTLPEQGAGPRARPLQADPDVGGQREPEVFPLGPDHGLPVAPVGVAPAGALTPVVEHRLAVEGELDRSVHAAHRPQQGVLGVIVGRRPAVRGPLGVLVPPRAQDQAVPDDDPALAAVPAGLED